MTETTPTSPSVPVDQLADTDTKTCPRCAESVKAAAAVCRYCQYQFETVEAEQPGATTRPPRSRRRTVALGVVAFLVLALAAFGFIRITSLSDAEVSWCHANTAEVGVMADSLGLAAPTYWPDWTHWGMAAEGSIAVWDDKAYISAGDRPSRDRACRAAYQLR